MASIAHHFDFDNVPIFSHPPPHFGPNSALIKTTTALPNFSSSSSAHRHPLLSISQAPSNKSTTSSFNSLASLTESRSTQTRKSSPPSRETRRKVRSTRTGSPPSALPISSPDAPSLRPRKKPHLGQLDVQHQDQTTSDSDNDVDYKPLVPYRRLNLTCSIAPSAPPAIPDHIMIPQSHCSHLHTPLVEPAYETPRETAKDTHTCIRTKKHPHSVSISTQPPVHFSKTIARMKRVKRTNLPSSPDNESWLGLKSSEEQDKWWSWSLTCPITGDANKSSHLTPLRCKDLKNGPQESFFEIQTTPISKFALGLQMMHYPG